MTDTDERMLIELDSRKRAPLRQLAKHDRYLASVSPDGVLTLTPAVVMTAFEATMRSKAPDLVTRLSKTMQHPERLVHPEPSPSVAEAMVAALREERTPS